MAKKQQPKAQKGNGQGNGKQNAVNLGSVTRSIESTERARESLRKESSLREKRRAAEREQGTFHERTNAGRASDIQSAIRGETGSYAYPGGNAPSVHFNVQKELSGPSIRIESIQDGHELQGRVFNPNIFLPCHYIEKFGTSFISRKDDRLAAATQELICHYFAQATGVVDEKTNFDQLCDGASTKLEAMIDGQDGLYRFEKEGKKAILEVFTTKWPNLKVIMSDFPELTAGRVFIPVHCLLKPSLDKVTDDEVFQKQFALYMFLRNELGETLLQKKEAVPQKQLSPKEVAKLAKKRLENLQDANDRAARETALHAMKQNAIGIIPAASGRLGYVQMGNSSGELMIQFGMDGADRVISVGWIADSHILRLAKVGVGTWVYSGQVRAGMVSRHDYGADRLTKEEVGAKTALINYLREQFAASRIQVPERKKPHLALAA